MFVFVWTWESAEAARAHLTLSCLPMAGWPGPASVSVSELERRRLEEALEAAQGEARGAQLREEQLQAECERLQGELKQLQESRAQVTVTLELPLDVQSIDQQRRGEGRGEAGL